MSNYAENICVAIDQIVTSRLEGLSYDITKLCTIVDDTEKHNGKYIVTDGATKFDAYSSDNNLREGNSVLVNIPNGDFNMQKTIIGKQTATNTQPFIYTAPLETMIPVESGITNQYIEENCNKLRANDPDQGETAKRLFTIKGKNNFIGFTRLGISADFKSWFAGYEVLSGQYGLRMYLTTKETNTSNNEINTRIYELTLSNDDMYGNPYNFETFFNQEKVFDISSINNIEEVDVWFYQNQNFIGGNGELIPYREKSFEGTEAQKLSYNLFVDNIKFYLGYDQNAFTEDALFLYTDSARTYNNTLAKQTKDVYLRWIHKKEDGTFELITDLEKNPDLTIKWYRYKIGEPAADSYSGVYWKNMGEDNKLSIQFDPDITKATEEIKAIGYINSTDQNVVLKAYYSDLMIFENESEVANQPTVDITQALQIVFEDDSDGNYFIYNQNGKLIDSSQGSGKKRTMKVLYKGAELSDGMGVQEIIWYIPYRDSMIKLDSSYYVNSQTTINDNDSSVKPIYDYKYKSYYEIKRDTSEEVNSKQVYYIYDQWSPSYANNTISCYVKINNVVYETYFDLKFGKAGTNGSNVTFLLNFDYGRNSLSLEDYNNKNAAYGLKITGIKDPSEEDIFVRAAIDPNKELTFENSIPISFGQLNDAEIQVSAHLYDASGVDLNLSELLKNNSDSMRIAWSWKYGASSEMDFFPIEEDSSLQKVTLQESIKVNIKNNYNILQATLEGYGDGPNLISYLPIPIKTSNQHNYISGAKEVIYDHQGIPSYYRGVYNLYGDNVGKEDGLNWGITCAGREIEKNDTDYTISNLPKLKNTENGQGLSASAFYLKDQNDKVCVYCEKDGEILWSQPILIIQNQYDFSMLNEWDGSLTINEENDTILSAMLGAGRKNSDNTFSGVLIGDLKATENDSVNSQTGVYGLHKGVVSYALKEDGTATFGEVGRGQIFINTIQNNELTSQITSANYLSGNTGLLIDLDDGVLDIRNKDTYHKKVSNESVNKNNYNSYYIKNNDGTYSVPTKYEKSIQYYEQSLTTSQANIRLEPNNEKKPYFQIKSAEGNSLINIGTNDYFLQSDNYSNNTGMKIDLANGSIKTAKQGSGSILIQPNEPFFQVQDNTNSNLIYMGTDNYYLESAGYDGTAQKWGFYDDDQKFLVYKYNGVEYAVIGETFYTITGGNIDSFTGQITDATITKYSFPTDIKYKETTSVGGEKKTEEKTYTESQLKKIYMAKMIPVLTNTEPNGLRIDLNSGIILGYNLYLKGTASDNKENKFFILDSSAPQTPFQIGPSFKVDWNGGLTCDSIAYLGTGPKTGDWVINIADNFVINSSGGGSGSSFHAGSAGMAAKAKEADYATALVGPDFTIYSFQIKNLMDDYYAHTHTYDYTSVTSKGGLELKDTYSGGDPSHTHQFYRRAQASFGTTTGTTSGPSGGSISGPI